MSFALTRALRLIDSAVIEPDPSIDDTSPRAPIPSAPGSVKRARNALQAAIEAREIAVAKLTLIAADHRARNAASPNAEMVAVQRALELTEGDLQRARVRMAEANSDWLPGVTAALEPRRAEIRRMIREAGKTIADALTELAGQERAIMQQGLPYDPPRWIIAAQALRPAIAGTVNL